MQRDSLTANYCKYQVILVSLLMLIHFFQSQRPGTSPRFPSPGVHRLPGDDPAGDPGADDGQEVPDPAQLLRQSQSKLSQRRSILVEEGREAV
jgi:hypothetical protein